MFINIDFGFQPYVIFCLFKIYMNIMQNDTNLSQLSISAWNVHGLGEKLNDESFLEKINNDINILLETWTGINKKVSLPDYASISKSRKKRKKCKRNSGGIIVFYKKTLSKGLTYLEKGTKSENRLWLKLDRNFFDFDKDLYVCSVYIPPINSNYYENDFETLENEISIFANKGKILLVGDFNSRTGCHPDYIVNDSLRLNDFSEENILPRNYLIDSVDERKNQDKISNNHGKKLLEMCISSRLRILNGRYMGDSLGFFTCLTSNGLSCVDYAILSESLLPSVLYFITQDFNYLSDHAQIKVILKCNIKKESRYSSICANWAEVKGYKWSAESSIKLINALSNDKVRTNIIDFEIKSFSEDQKGVDEATEVLNTIFCEIADQSCKKVKSKKKQKRERKF